MKIGDVIAEGVKSVTSDWTKYRKKQERDAKSAANYYNRMMRVSNPKRSIKDIVYEVMEEAYLKASAGGTLPAAARQIFYQARPLVLAQTDERFDSQYFTTNLLPEYIEENPQTTATWDVVFDARGHLWEPHTEHEVPLGTLAVREYLASVRHKRVNKVNDQPTALRTGCPTIGPTNRYHTVLFIEKEGFMPLLRQKQIDTRYDLAIMSTKGQSPTAARSLMERLDGVRFLVLHDFDKWGFSILGVLTRDTNRYRFSRPPNVTDLGLRLTDVEQEGLEPEPVVYKESNPRPNLRKNGASSAEIEFLVTGHTQGQRVELNAFTSDHFIEWLERKLNEHKVEKIIPDGDTLATAYRRAVYVHHINSQIAEAGEQARQVADSAIVPERLSREVNRLLKQNPGMSWDVAVARIAAKNSDPKKGNKKK